MTLFLSVLLVLGSFLGASSKKDIAAIKYFYKTGQIPFSKEQASKIYNEVNRIGASRKMNCFSRFTSKEVYELASKSTGIRLTLLAMYLKTKKGKDHLKVIMSACMKLKKK